MNENPIRPEAGEPAVHTRREFIRRVLLTTAYVAPVIVSLSVTGMASGASQGQSQGNSMGGSPMSPMSPMRMMSPMAMNTQSMGMRNNSGDLWK